MKKFHFFHDLLRADLKWADIELIIESIGFALSPSFFSYSKGFMEREERHAHCCSQECFKNV